MQNSRRIYLLNLKKKKKKKKKTERKIWFPAVSYVHTHGLDYLILDYQLKTKNTLSLNK